MVTRHARAVAAFGVAARNRAGDTFPTPQSRFEFQPLDFASANASRRFPGGHPARPPARHHAQPLPKEHSRMPADARSSRARAVQPQPRCARRFRTLRAQARAKQFSRTLRCLRCARSAAPHARCARSAARLALERAPNSTAACSELKRAKNLGRPGHDLRLRPDLREPARPAPAVSTVWRDRQTHCAAHRPRTFSRSDYASSPNNSRSATKGK